MRCRIHRSNCFSRRNRKPKAGNQDQALREQLVSLLKGGQAHVHFMDAIDGFPEAKRGTFVEGLPHTGWQLMEHVRIAQWDILEFSRNPKHVSPGFPEGYWPKTPEPPGEAGRSGICLSRAFSFPGASRPKK